MSSVDSTSACFTRKTFRWKRMKEKKLWRKEESEKRKKRGKRGKWKTMKNLHQSWKLELLNQLLKHGTLALIWSQNFIFLIVTQGKEMMGSPELQMEHFQNPMCIVHCERRVFKTKRWRSLHRYVSVITKSKCEEYLWKGAHCTLQTFHSVFCDNIVGVLEKKSEFADYNDRVVATSH